MDRPDIPFGLVRIQGSGAKRRGGGGGAERVFEMPVQVAVNVAVNSKPDHVPGRPLGIRTLSLPRWSGFRTTFFALGVGVLNWKNLLQF